MSLHPVFKFIVPFLATTAVERGFCDLNTISSCTCLNSDIIYTCVVNQPGFTIWQGSAFDCAGQLNRILLRHTLFESGTMGFCNGGAIVGHSLGVSGGVYTSQLTVSVTSNLIGRMIECAYSLTGGTVTPINSTTIAITDPFPPPLGVQLTNVTTNYLTFSWDPMEFQLGSNCPTLQYSIETDCGNCSSNPQNTTSVTCSFDLSSIFTDDVCSFSVRTIICGNITGNFSEPIKIMLKVPASPSVSVVPTYNMAGNLSQMNITIRELDSYSIFNEIDGSVLYYTLTFVDSSTKVTCNATRILPSSCSNGICTLSLSDSALPCSGLAKSGDITISVSASNVLGTGPTSHVSVGAINQYVDVRFEQVVDQGNESTRVSCIFPNETNVWSELSCKIEYKPCQDQNMTSQVVGTIRNSSNTVIINLLVNLKLKTYCYTISASNGNFTILIEDIMSSSGTQGDPSSTNSQNIVIGVLVPVCFIAVITTLVIVLVVLKFKQRQYTQPRNGCGTTSGEGAATFIPEEGVQTVKAHICFDLEDKPHQLLNALTALIEILSKINIKNIKIGPLQDKVRRIYIENESQLSEKDGELIMEKMKVDGSVPEKLEVYLESQPKSIPTRTEVEYQTQKIITEVLEHQPGALCDLMNAVLSIDDDSNCMHINITDITVEDEGIEHKEIEHKRVTIKFIPVLEDIWKKKYDENKGKMCKFIVNGGSSSK